MVLPDSPEETDRRITMNSCQCRLLVVGKAKDLEVCSFSTHTFGSA